MAEEFIVHVGFKRMNPKRITYNRGRAIPAVQENPVSSACFLLFLYFIVDFFLRFSTRLPIYGALRPSFMLFLVISGILFLNRDSLKGRTQDPIFRAFFVLIGYLVISLPIVEWPGSVIRQHISDFVLATCFLFFTAFIIDSERRLKWFLVVFVSCQVFRVLEPLYLNITQGYWGSSTFLAHNQYADRLAGAPADVINSNELGFVIVTAIPFLHYLLFPKGWKSKVLYVALMGALLYALILTMSRGAFIALLVIGFMVFKESRHKFGLVAVGILVAVMGWNIMSPVQKDRYLSLVDPDASSTSGATVEGRIEGIKREFILGMNRPVVGHGLGTTPEAKYHFFGRREASHNLYAQLLIEIGLVGAIIFLTFLFRIYNSLNRNRSLIKILDKDPSSFYNRLNKTMIALFFMYAVYSINYWGLSQYYWYLFAGLVIAFGRLLLKEQAKQEALQEGVADTAQEPRKSRFPSAPRSYNRRRWSSS